VKDADGIVQTILLFTAVPGCMKQFSSTYQKRSFRIHLYVPAACSKIAAWTSICLAIDPYGCTEFDSTYTAQPAITRIISLQVAPTAFSSGFRPLTLTRTGAGMRSNTASE